jgi:hypothetical protein
MAGDCCGFLPLGHKIFANALEPRRICRRTIIVGNLDW